MVIPVKNSRVKNLDQNGFSLIEAMVAIAIFAIGILGVYMMQFSAVNSNAYANRISTATSWAGYAVEEILGKPFAHADLADDGGVDPPAPDGWGGLDDTGNTADGMLFIQTDGSTEDVATGNDLYSIYWNIVEGGDPNDLIGTQDARVLDDTKLIRVHVIRNRGIGKGHLYSHDYFKTLYPE